MSSNVKSLVELTMTPSLVLYLRVTVPDTKLPLEQLHRCMRRMTKSHQGELKNGLFCNFVPWEFFSRWSPDGALRPTESRKSKL